MRASRRVRRRCKQPLLTSRRTSSAVEERSMPRSLLADRLEFHEGRRTYEDLIDHDHLRHDPALTALLDKPGGRLAGKSASLSEKRSAMLLVAFCDARYEAILPIKTRRRRTQPIALVFWNKAEAQAFCQKVRRHGMIARWSRPGGSTGSFIKCILARSWIRTGTVSATFKGSYVAWTTLSGSGWTPYGSRPSSLRQWLTLAMT